MSKQNQSNYKQGFGQGFIQIASSYRQSWTVCEWKNPQPLSAASRLFGEERHCMTVCSNCAQLTWVTNSQQWRRQTAPIGTDPVIEYLASCAFKNKTMLVAPCETAMHVKGKNPQWMGNQSQWAVGWSQVTCKANLLRSPCKGRKGITVLRERENRRDCYKS